MDAITLRGKPKTKLMKKKPSMRTFDSVLPSAPARSIQVWQILIGKAMSRQTITYQGLAKLMFKSGRGAGVLGPHRSPQLPRRRCPVQSFQQ
jgi:hypothetical protein